MSLPYQTLSEFLAFYDACERPVTIVAHQDDEVTFSGMLSRAGKKMKICWVTNGDGLYFQPNVSPAEYGKIRMAEAIESAKAVGIPKKNTTCLAYSEVDIYKHFMHLSDNTEAIRWVKEFFQPIADDVRDYVFKTRPQVVFTCAYQGGNPEHDVTHYLTRIAVDAYEKETGETVPFIHVPMYEYVILVALRFNPFYRGLRWRYELRDQEKANKRAQFDAYPSQEEVFSGFRKVIGALGWLGYLKNGRKMTPESYLAVEEFGPVPEDWDYLANPHRFDWANYIGDHFGKTPVTWERSIKPIVQAFPRPR